ncbi:MAG: hypothetical protein ACQCN5_09770 [Candidatus Bathyarchaeia archaeon]|jgi:hypothetical protein
MKKVSIIAIAVASILLISSLGLAINFAAATQNHGENSNRPLQKSWVRINGVINCTWNDQDVNGILQTRSRTTLLASENKRELTSATAIWTTEDSRPINSVRAKENFTYTFYAARLNNASISEFSIDDSDYFLNGTWNIYTVTSSITVITDENNTIVSVHRDSDTQVSQANGNLTITDNWSKFTLKIDNQDDLSGTVFRTLTRMAEFNRFAMIDQSATKISRADLNQISTCFRAMPGWGNYDAQMDFNGNFKIDITDLSTVAANI